MDKNDKPSDTLSSFHLKEMESLILLNVDHDLTSNKIHTCL